MRVACCVRCFMAAMDPAAVMAATAPQEVTDRMEAMAHMEVAVPRVRTEATAHRARTVPRVAMDLLVATVPREATAPMAHQAVMVPRARTVRRAAMVLTAAQGRMEEAMSLRTALPQPTEPQPWSSRTQRLMLACG